MAEESDIKIYKLNFFQRIRKSMFLRSIDKKRGISYVNMPDYIKYDDEVIDGVISENPSLIDSVPFEKAKKYIFKEPELSKYINNSNSIDALIQVNPETIKFMDEKAIIRQIEAKPNLIVYLEEKQINQLAYSIGEMDNKKFLHFLPIEQQQNMILSRHTTEIGKDIVNFSEEAIISSARFDEENFKRANFNEVRNFRWLEKYDLTQLPLTTQAKLIEVSPVYMKLVDENAVIKYVGDNALLYGKIPDNIKLDMLEKDRSLLPRMPVSFQRECLEKYPMAAKYTHMSGYFNKEAFGNAEDAITAISIKGRELLEKEKKEITKDYQDKEYILEMGRYQPDFVMIGEDSSQEEISGLLSIFVDYTKEVDQYGKLTNTFQEYYDKLKNNPESVFQNRDTINRLIKLSLNDEILHKVEGDILVKYAEAPSNKLLSQIIQTAYGENSAQIIREKPDITDDIIPNYYIFDPRIIELFGENDIYANFYTRLPNSGVLVELARKPELIQSFKEFEELSGKLFVNTPLGLNAKLAAFMDVKSFFKENHVSELNSVQRDNFNLAIMDRMEIFSGVQQAQELFAFPKNKIELNHYKDKRNQILDDNIHIENNPETIRNLISKRFFGMGFDKEFDKNTFLSPRQLVDLKNTDIFKSRTEGKNELFSKSELDYFELSEILRYIDDSNQMKNLATMFRYNEAQMNPLRFFDFQKKLSNSGLMYIPRIEKLEDSHKKEVLTVNGNDSGMIVAIKQQLSSSIEEFDR